MVIFCKNLVERLKTSFNRFFFLLYRILCNFTCFFEILNAKTNSDKVKNKCWIKTELLR